MHRLSATRVNAIIRTWHGLIANARSRIDWTRRDVRDGMIISVLIVLCFAAAHFFGLPAKWFQFAIENQNWEVDDLIFMFFVASFAFAVYSFRRMQDLVLEIKARKRAEFDARRLARHDPLTGLPNRRFFVESLRQVLRETTAASRSAILMMDLDGFKLINDAYGHAVGDLVLADFARRISATMRAGAIFSRVGGDEFAVIVPSIGSLGDPARLARRIVACVAEPFVVGSIQARLGVGIGIAVAPEDGMELEVLVQHADRALYRAKAEGRNGIRFFETVMNEHVERRIVIESELRAAIAAKSIVPFYQPVVAFAGQRIIGYEALARWNSDKLGWVPPDQFIVLAEEIGLIGELGDHLLRQACMDARTWPADTTLAVNVSGRQLRDSTLGLRILAILADTGFSPRRLELEITETALVDNMTVAQNIINQLRQAGVRIALDDFGTGYATLSQLLSFRLDRIKIDRSFVDRLGKDEESDTIVRAILGLAKGFGLATTAEGIEDADQLAALKANGCLVGQGYLFGKAVPANDIVHVLEQVKPDMKVAG